MPPTKGWLAALVAQPATHKSKQQIGANRKTETIRSNARKRTNDVVLAASAEVLPVTVMLARYLINIFLHDTRLISTEQDDSQPACSLT